MIIFTKEYWDAFLSKLFSLFVSVKVWTMVLSVWVAFMAVDHFSNLLLRGSLTSQDFSAMMSSMFTSFSTIFVGIIGIRGALEFVDVYRNMKETISGQYHRKTKKREEDEDSV